MGKETDPKRIEELEKLLRKSVRMMENYYLRDHKFIHGDEISVADLMAVTEFTQFWAMGVDPAEGKPRLSRWMGDCREALQPTFDEVHSMVYMARDRGLFKGQIDLKGKL